MDLFIQINAEFPWYFATLFGVFGAIVGSFLNVCIYRIPAERSVVTPRSTCACGKMIPWYDNIPVLSWILLRGKARCCGQPFSIRYPAIEALTAGLFLACWLHLPPAHALAGMIFGSMLICATFIDFDHMIIPDRFSIGTAIVGMVLSVLLPSLHVVADSGYIVNAVRSLVHAGIGVMVGSGLILWIGLLAEVVLKKEAMGFGDVKLIGGIGAFCGWQGAVFSLFGGAIIGTFGVLIVLIAQAMAGKSGTESGEDNRIGFGRHIPFGPMLAAGALLYFLWLRPYVDQYFLDLTQLLFAKTA